MIELLSGALVFAYFVAGVHFVRFWRKTADRFFLYFAIAFELFAINRLLVSLHDVANDAAGYEDLLRVLGFLLILAAIIQKNSTKPAR